ncbi:hypothetical protein TFLX_00270 [Thermoflexales bacterium]|nr:hypothetical protein TFLX_00270 [Thermoflexales bacterium]
MTLLQFILLVVVAAICGAIGQALAGYSLGGCLVSTIVGFIGAVVGVWLAQQLGLPEILTVQIGGETFPVVWSIIGSALLALGLGMLSRRRSWRW